jgi:hypothetical protein
MSWLVLKVDTALCLVKRHAMNTYGAWRYSCKQAHPQHWTEVSGHLHAPAALLRLKGPRYQLYNLVKPRPV